jgi:hypothetical protein
MRISGKTSNGDYGVDLRELPPTKIQEWFGEVDIGGILSNT